MVQHLWINPIYHVNKMKDKSDMICSTDTEKAFDKIQYSFMMKIFNKVHIEVLFLSIINVIYNKPTGNIILNS